jgi:hypothetical protein
METGCSTYKILAAVVVVVELQIWDSKEAVHLVQRRSRVVGAEVMEAVVLQLVVLAVHPAAAVVVAMRLGKIPPN